MNDQPWKPSKPVAYLLAVLTVWPVIYIGLFMSVFMFTFVSIGHKASGPPIDVFKYVFPLHCLTMLIIFGLTGAYVVHAFRNDELSSDKRTLWVVVLFMGNMLAFPVYWWFYIRPGASQKTAVPPASAG